MATLLSFIPLPYVLALNRLLSFLFFISVHLLPSRQLPPPILTNSIDANAQIWTFFPFSQPPLVFFPFSFPICLPFISLLITRVLLLLHITDFFISFSVPYFTSTPMFIYTIFVQISVLDVPICYNRVPSSCPPWQPNSVINVLFEFSQKYFMWLPQLVSLVSHCIYLIYWCWCVVDCLVITPLYPKNFFLSKLDSSDVVPILPMSSSTQYYHDQLIWYW